MTWAWWAWTVVRDSEKAWGYRLTWRKRFRAWRWLMGHALRSDAAEREGE